MTDVHRLVEPIVPGTRTEPGRSSPLRAAGLALVLAILVVSGIHPYSHSTWWLEIAPILFALPVLYAYRRYRLSSLLWWVILVHMLILVTGGYYTYARVPVGFLVEHWLGGSRNSYDRLEHIFQGITPALLVREICWRNGAIRGNGWVRFFAVSVALAFSACYELIEWGTAEAMGQGTDDFLGTQGDVWDTQKDMASAGLGALAAIFLPKRWQVDGWSGPP